jgi:glyoxylase-like metal-dependent hydrolase (beta-lactamase superfamily II)
MLNIKTIKGTIIRTNNYVIESDDSCVIIEASAKTEDVKSILKNKKVDGILLTHGHWDHYEQLDKYLKEFNCKVYLTKEGFYKINNKEKQFKVDRNPNIKLLEQDVVFICDKQVLTFGEMKFKVISTKGHTDCSVSYLLNNQYLFSGDTLFKNGVGRDDLPTGNYKDLLESLKSLFKLDGKIIVYPGHGDKTTIFEEIKNNI